MNYRFIFVVLFVAILAPGVIAEVLFVDSINGNDTNPGTRVKPLSTLGKAAVLVNGSSEKGSTTIKIAPGVYNLTKAVVFENTRSYTKQQRLTIEAAVLPDDQQWKPALMPVILSAEIPQQWEKTKAQIEAFGLKIEINHVTIRGLKFLGSPVSHIWYYPVFREGKNLEDLVITQCLFTMDSYALSSNVAIIANGHGLVVDHCIFYNCRNPVVFWNAKGGISKNNAMRYCIVDGAYTSGVWVCQTAEDFEFHNNIITRSKYTWMRNSSNQRKYRLHDCIITDNEFYSGECGSDWELKVTGPEIAYNEKEVIKTGKVVLEMGNGIDLPVPRNFLHPVPGTLGSGLGAGLFTKPVRATEVKEQDYRKETVAYKEVKGQRILADVYLPVERKIRPAFIYLHGGGFIFGNRTGCRKPLRDKLLEAGYVVISADYRLAPETKLEEMVEDVKDVCKWVREKGPELFNINPKRVAVGGGSAGGVLTLIAGYAVEPRPQALVVVSGPAGEAKDARLWKGDRSLIKKGTPYDIVSDKIVSDGGYSDRMELWRWLAKNRLLLSEVLGFDPESDMERFKRLIPLENITNDYPATLIVQARRDRLAPFSQAEKLAYALRAKEVEHEMFVVPDGHSSEIIRNYPEAVAKIASFLDRHLKGTKKR